MIQGAWLKIILGPALSLVCVSVPLYFLVKINGHIIGFDVLADFTHAMRSVPDIKKVSRCIVRGLLLGAFFGPCQLPMGGNHYALAHRGLQFLSG
ncbi:hypothetical protein D3C73_1484200 [compost metagenome]